MATRVQRKPSRKRANPIEMKGLAPQQLDDRGNIAFVRGCALLIRGFGRVTGEDKISNSCVQRGHPGFQDDV